MLIYIPPLPFFVSNCQKFCSSTLVLLLTETEDQMVNASGRSEEDSVAKEEEEEEVAKDSKEAQSVTNSSAPIP